MSKRRPAPPVLLGTSGRSVNTTRSCFVTSWLFVLHTYTTEHLSVLVHQRGKETVSCPSATVLLKNPIQTVVVVLYNGNVLRILRSWETSWVDTPQQPPRSYCEIPGDMEVGLWKKGREKIPCDSRILERCNRVLDILLANHWGF